MNFTTSYPGAVAAFKGEACFTLDGARDRILHCLSQLDDTQVGSRPHPGMNAIGNIVLHVCGNLRQWVVVGCDRYARLEDDRDRPAEFAVTGGPGVTELTARLTDTVAQAQTTIRTLDKDDLLRCRVIQTFDVTGFGAIWHSVSHLEGHARETIYATRLLLGDAYRFKDTY